MDSKPALVSHWVHSGPELSEVATRAGSSSTSWKAFTTEDDARIERAWQSLDPTERESVLAKAQREATGAAPGSEEEADLVLNLEADALPHVVPVGPDSLFTVDLSTLRLVPGFWRGPSVCSLRLETVECELTRSAKVNVQRASWFFPTTKPSAPFQPSLCKG